MFNLIKVREFVAYRKNMTDLQVILVEMVAALRILTDVKICRAREIRTCSCETKSSEFFLDSCHSLDLSAHTCDICGSTLIF